MGKIFFASLFLFVIIVSGCVNNPKYDLGPRVKSPDNIGIPTDQISPIAGSEKICPAVCAPLWTLQNNSCIFNNCGSGCGADNITTFQAESGCRSKLQ